MYSGLKIRCQCSKPIIIVVFGQQVCSKCKGLIP